MYISHAKMMLHSPTALFFFFFFWLCWVLIAVRGLSLVAETVHGLLIVVASLVAENGL